MCKGSCSKTPLGFSPHSRLLFALPHAAEEVRRLPEIPRLGLASHHQLLLVPLFVHLTLMLAHLLASGAGRGLGLGGLGAWGLVCGEGGGFFATRRFSASPYFQNVWTPGTPT